MPADRKHYDHSTVVAAIAGVAALIGIGVGVSRSDLSQSTASASPNEIAQIPASQEAVQEADRIAVQSVVTSDLGAAEAGQPATRSPVEAVLTDEKLPADLSATIEALVTTASGCTLTRVGDTMITAAHCHPFGFTVEGDIAWDGAEPVWLDPALIPIGATVYAVGYPQASPGPQTFTLANLGLHTVTVEDVPVEVLMAVGDGVPCTSGSSGIDRVGDVRQRDGPDRADVGVLGRSRRHRSPCGSIRVRVRHLSE